MFIPTAHCPRYNGLMSSASLAGAMNFRDLGGIPGLDGRQVRHGLIYRSGELNSLTAEDLETLAYLGIRYVFDMRTAPERAAAPTHWPENPPTIIARSVGFDDREDPAASMKMFFARGIDAANIAAAMRGATVKIALDGAPAMGEILRDLGRVEHPAMIHCTAGKDRTGIVTAVLLNILGAEREHIYEEYLRSNAAVPGLLARLKSPAVTGLPPALAALPLESLQILMGVDRSFLGAAFQTIDARYGAFDAYVREGLKLTPEDIEALRTRLLA